MNYSIHYPLFRISLICLLWVIFGRTPLDAQNKDTLLNFSIRNAALDKFAKQLEDSTGFSFIYGEKIQLKKPVTLDMTQSPITDILHRAFENEAIAFKISGKYILLDKRETPVNRKYTISGYVTDGISSETLIGTNIFEQNRWIGTSTNPFGFYSITLPEGDAALSFSYLGYATQICRFRLEKDTLLNIRLLTDNQLEEVVVLSNKRETGIHATAMSALDVPMKQIRNTPVVLGEADLLKTIQLLPGVQAGMEGIQWFACAWRRTGPEPDPAGWYSDLQCRSPAGRILDLHPGGHEKSDSLQRLLSCPLWRTIIVYHRYPHQ